MDNTLLDNSEKFLMKDVLSQFIGSGKYNHICIATGYWDLPGTALVYDQLKTFLEAGGRLDILIGQEPQLRSYQTHTPDSDEERFPDFYLQRDINLLTDEYRPTAELIQRFCNVGNVFTDNNSMQCGNQDDSQIQIRIYGQNEQDKKQFLHAKCYIFLGPGEAEGIIGSSNFTEKGLQDNAELNYLETQNCIITATHDEYSNSKSHKVWFDEKWALSEPWNGKFLQILAAAPVVQHKPTTEPEQSEQHVVLPLTPYELYIKLLQTKFGDLVDKNLENVIESYLPKRYDCYTYQMDAVKQCFSTMKQHGGFLLADVVGLGKTIVGALVIKHFLNYPDEDGRERKVLVITPPAIRSSWVDTIKEFDKDCIDPLSPYIDYITTGSIGKLVDDSDNSYDEGDTGAFDTDLKNENYGLIIIDESHKFRNSESSMYKSLDSLIEQIYRETGNCPYIGLLSATPQNNRPNDLKNQIYLFERNRNESTLKKANGGNLENFFAEINRDYAVLISNSDSPFADDNDTIGTILTPEERQDRLKKISTKIRDCILTDIMIRRTRTDVKNYYSQDLEKQGIIFPDIKGPIALKYKMSPELAHLFSDTMDLISPSEYFRFDNSDYLCYYRYRAVQFLINTEEKSRYAGRGNRDTDALALQLAKIMQINLVKRLESSFAAFKQSLLNLRNYTWNMIKMWEKNTIFICPDIDVNKELNLEEKKKTKGHAVTFEDCVEDIRKKISRLTEEGRNDDGNNKEYTRNDFMADYIKLLNHDYELICKLYDRWAQNSEDPKFDEFKDNLRYRLFDEEKNKPHKLVIFSEAIDTAKSIKAAAENKGYKVLLITAKDRDENELKIKENFDANYKGDWKNDYDIIVTTDVLAEGINLHRANCILNYDTPWNSTKLMQRIGRVNRIGSTEKFVYVFNFMPSAEGDAEINLVRKAHTKLQSFHTLFGEDSKIFSEDEEVAHYDLDKTVNGEESPLEKYVYELKEYKAFNPDRYAEIEKMEDGLEMSSVNFDGCGYFMVRTPKMAGMYVKVDPKDDEGHIISMIDMFSIVKMETNAVKCELPVNWSNMKTEAERVVTAELADAKFRRGNSNRATQAKGVIKKMKETQAMSTDSKKLLTAADKLVRAGNNDIIKRILKIGQAVEDHNTLMPFTQEDFDNYLQEGIAKMVAEVQLRQGKPSVFIGFNK